MGQMLFPSSVPDTELVLYPLQDKLTSGDKSLDLSAFKLSRLFFSLLSLGSSSCWRSYGAQYRDMEMLRLEALGDHPLIKFGVTTMDKLACVDMVNSQNLMSTRTDLMRTNAEKEELLRSYRAM
ncbi:hypothetical protein Tco_1294622 [Tanacetum coccineum]